MTKEQHRNLIVELIECYTYLQEIEPHFVNLRKIKELEEQLKNIK